MSEDILSRPVGTGRAAVLQILIAWSDLFGAYNGDLPPRAANRDRAAAESQVRSIREKLKAGTPFEKLMATESEDAIQVKSGRPYVVRADGTYESGFQSLALRLKVGEVGVCETRFGFHIVKRVE